MKVLIDMTFVSPKSMHQSLPIAVMRMLCGVPKEERGKLKLLFDTGSAEMLHKLFPDYDYLTVNVMNMRRLYYDPRLLLVPFAFCRAINHSGCDAVFFTTDGSRYARSWLKIPSIVEINDLKWLKEDTQTKKISFYSLALRLLSGSDYRRYKNTVNRAKLITTISQYTKDDLLRLFPEIPREKVHVIYLSVPEIFESKKPSGLQDGERYILNVNTLVEFKNPLTLLKAFAIMADKYEGKMILVGRTTDYWDNVLSPFITNNHLEGRVVRLQNLEDAELRYLYEHAELFVTPSLHEGFGFTPVEAAIYRCPVVCSRSESLPEVTMNLLKYYEPATDECELAKAMIEVISSPPSLRKREMISLTFREFYSASRHAKKLFDLFLLLNNIN